MQAVKYHHKAAFETMDNLYFPTLIGMHGKEVIDRGGAGSSDMAYTTMLTIITEHVNQHTVTNLLNLAQPALSQAILPLLSLGSLSYKHTEPSFSGKCTMLEQAHAYYVESQRRLRIAVDRQYVEGSNARSSNAVEKLQIYSNDKASLGNLRADGPGEYELAKQKSGQGECYAILKATWGLMPKREGAARHIAKGAIILSRTFIPSGKDENPTDKDMHMKGMHTSYRRFTNVPGLQGIKMTKAPVEALIPVIFQSLRYALIPDLCKPLPFIILWDKSQRVGCLGPCGLAWIPLVIDGLLYCIIDPTKVLLFVCGHCCHKKYIPQLIERAEKIKPSIPTRLSSAPLPVQKLGTMDNRL